MSGFIYGRNPNADTLDGLEAAAFAILAGQAGGQVLQGGTAANEDLTLEGTAHATKATSRVVLQPNGGGVSIGTTAGDDFLTIAGSRTIPNGQLITGQNVSITAAGVADDASVQGIRAFNITTDLTGAYDMGTIASIYAVTTNASSAASNVTHFIGIVGVASHAGAGSITDMYGQYGRIDISAGAVTRATAVVANAPLLTGGTLGTYYGFYSAPGSMAGSSATNAYSAFFGGPTGASNHNIALAVGGVPGAPWTGALYVDGNSILTGSLTLGTSLVVTADVQIKGHIYAINKAADNWLVLAAKDSTGSENVYNFGYVGRTEYTEVSAPGAGAANTARVYAVDNGAGKTQLMVQFATGVAQQLAIEA